MERGNIAKVGGPAWITIAIAVSLTILVMFLLWAVVEGRYATDPAARDLLHIARGVSTSVIAAAVLGLILVRWSRAKASALRSTISEAEHERDATQKLADAVIESIPSAVIVVDEDRRIHYANRVAEGLHGSKLHGHVCSDVFQASEERCRVCSGCDTLTSGKSAVAAVEVIEPRTGAVLELSSYPVTLPSGSPAALIVENVITEQKKLQASLVHQEKMAAFGLVAAGVAHEMGNPLSSIEMHLQLLDESGLAEEDAESIRTVRSETARLRRTLRELVDFSRKRRDEASWVSVESVIGDALRLIRYDRRMRNVEVDLEADPTTPPVFMVEDHLMQTMVNLFINALDAMPEGGSLRIDLRHVDKRVAVRVRDSGMGMSKPTLERCFEPLYTTKEAGKGTGLGLSICRDVLEAAGGSIEMHSAHGRGSTAVITLPAALAEQSQPHSLPLAGAARIKSPLNAREQT